MAKSITPDQLESILTSVLAKAIPEVLCRELDKFESCLDKLQEKFETKMDKVYGELYVVNDRIYKLAADMKSLTDEAEQHAVLPGASVTNAVTTTPDPVQLLMAVETEKSERMTRKHNVIIFGLPQVHHKADDETFLDFCENHLTLKPKPRSCVRIGRANDGPRKLKVTFDDDSAVDDLLSSSQLLRQFSEF